VSTFGEAVWGEGVWGDGAITSLTIDGDEYIDSCLVAGTRISKASGGTVQTMEFTLVLVTGATAVNEGSLVECRINTVLEFSGYISRMSADICGNPNFNFWHIACQDHMRLLEAAYTGAEVFSSTNDKAILDYLFPKYLAEVSVAAVQEIVEIGSIDLSYISLREAVEKLAERSQAIWYLSPAKALQYHEQGYSQAPFGLAEDADEVSAWPILRKVSYDREFSTPCNLCRVSNMASEEFTQAGYTPAATGDDGEISRVSGTTEYPPTGSYTAETAGNTMTARQQKINPSSDSIAPTTGGDEDGYVHREGSSYPPAGETLVLLDEGIVRAQATRAGSSFEHAVGLMFFDTSALPDTCEITDATLGITVDDYADDGISFPQLGIEWYSGSNRPIATDDWTYIPSNSAYGYTDLDDVGSSLALLNPNSEISRTGYTGLRLHCRIPGGVPDGANSIDISAGATLTINYVYGGTTYKVDCALVRFDTSALPDTAVVSGATLKLKIAAKAQTDNLMVLMEWYAGTNWPIGDADWSMNPASAAIIWYGYIKDLPAVGQWLSVPLLYAATGISLTGYTGIRILAWGVPFAGLTGDNSVSFSTQETADAPELDVVYVPGAMISEVAEDTDSQTEYGIFSRHVIDAAITEDADATQRAEAEVLAGAWPQQTLSGTIEKYGLDIGQTVQVDMPSIGLSENLLIRSVEFNAINPREFRYTFQAGDYRMDLIRFLRRVG
jgi:hypothetical protein